jgi:energy-coupling factor transport system substrate-specific component
MILYYLIKRKNRITITIFVVLSAVALNGLFSYINNLLSLPIFLDSIFTILTAALFGLWPAVTVGLLSNFFIETINGFPGIYYPFAIKNVLTALITAIFVSKKIFETPAHAFWLIITLTLINSLTGAIVVTIVFGGFTNLSMDNIVRGVMMTGNSIFSSVFIVRLVVNLVDKGIAVILAFSLYKAIQRKGNENLYS